MQLISFLNLALWMQNGKVTIRNDNEKKQNFCRELRLAWFICIFDTTICFSVVGMFLIYEG